MIKKPSTFTWYAILLVVAVGLGLIVPPASSTLRELHISLTEYKLAISTLILPYALIWFSAFYAYNRLEVYAHQIRQTKEGRAFKSIADGTRVLAWGLALTTLIGIISESISSSHPGFMPAQRVINNYIAILVPLIGFTLIGNGTRALNVLGKLRPSLTGTRVLVLVFLFIGVAFTYLVINNSAKQQNPYYLSLFLLFVTFIVPYLYAWFIGLLSANEIRLYAQFVKGIIYKRALIQLAGGLTLVISGSIVSQFINSVFITKHSIALGSAFLLTYFIVVLEAFGYGLIAYAVRSLKRIEEV
jgi:hypothetical protein